MLTSKHKDFKIFWNVAYNRLMLRSIILRGTSTEREINVNKKGINAEFNSLKIYYSLLM